MASVDMGELSVCVDCMLVAANGECDPDRPDSEPEPLALVGAGFHVSLGGDHRAGCQLGDEDIDCDCDEQGFSSSSCEGCGSGLGGGRFVLTLWKN